MSLRPISPRITSSRSLSQLPDPEVLPENQRIDPEVLPVNQPGTQPTLHQPDTIAVFRPNLGCGICFQKVLNPLLAASMPCCHHTHILHHKCAFQWYLSQCQRNLDPSCPFCRHKVFSIADFDALYTLTHINNIPPKTDLDDPDFSPTVYLTHSLDLPSIDLANSLNLIHLTSVSYILMIANLIFICWLLCMTRG